MNKAEFYGCYWLYKDQLDERISDVYSMEHAWRRYLELPHTDMFVITIQSIYNSLTEAI